MFKKVFFEQLGEKNIVRFIFSNSICLKSRIPKKAAFPTKKMNRGILHTDLIPILVFQGAYTRALRGYMASINFEHRCKESGKAQLELP
jgi:hypothetical protein